MLAPPLVLGAVNVAVHTPFVQAKAPSVPVPVSSAVKAPAPAEVIVVPLPSFTVTVMVAVPLNATLLADVAAVVCVALAITFAVKVRVSEPAVAVTDAAPSVVDETVHDVSVANPDASVVIAAGETGEMIPAPAAAAKVTTTPDTGLP